MIDVRPYINETGVEPFTLWLAGLRDKTAAAKILIRIGRVRAGNFGDEASVGEGVFELRVHVGAGYRVYFGRHGDVMVILLGGGDKSTQQSDIRRAKELWSLWRGKAT